MNVFRLYAGNVCYEQRNDRYWKNGKQFAADDLWLNPLRSGNPPALAARRLSAALGRQIRQIDIMSIDGSFVRLPEGCPSERPLGGGGVEDLERSGGEGPHMVYKLFSGSGDLLYIGITSRGPQRLAEHHRDKPWFAGVERVIFERFPTKAESAGREAYLIRTYGPLHNIQYNRLAV